MKEPLGWWQLLPVSLALGKWLPPRISFLISARGEECHSPNRAVGRGQQDCSRIRVYQRLFHLSPPPPQDMVFTSLDLSFLVG